MSVIYIDRNIITDRYPNRIEDGDRFYTYGIGSMYARQFKKFNKEIHVECWKADPRIKFTMEKEIQEVKHRVFPSLEIPLLGYYSKSMLRFYNHWRNIHHNTIYHFSCFDHLLFYSFASKMDNVPLVVQHHGEGTAIYRASIRKGLKKLFWTMRIPIERRCFKNIDLLYLLDKRLEEWLPQNAKNIEIKTSTTGADISLFTPMDKQEAKKALGLDINKKYLLYVGRLNQTKNPVILIDIFNELKKWRSDIGLILAGHEKTDPYYQKGRESGALMYGVIEQAELKKYLSAAEIYLLPRLSDNHKFGGIGLLPVQALLCNTPVIGGTMQSFPDYDRNLVGTVASTHQEIKAAIEEICDGRKKFKDLREIAIKHYSWQIISENTAADYKEVLRKYGR